MQKRISRVFAGVLVLLTTFEPAGFALAQVDDAPVVEEVVESSPEPLVDSSEESPVILEEPHIEEPNTPSDPDVKEESSLDEILKDLDPEIKEEEGIKESDEESLEDPELNSLLDEDPPPESEDPDIKINDGFKAGTKGRPNVDRQDGAMTYQYPFVLPEGRLGMTPELSLSYSSHVQNPARNIFGEGWELSIPRISRMTRYGTIWPSASTTKFESSLDGDLTFVGDSLTDTQYAASVERGSFNRYFYGADDVFIVKTKQGLTYTFGGATSSRLFDPSVNDQTISWFLSEIRDANGNYITYQYTKDENQLYPSHITYTHAAGLAGIYDISFVTEERTDDATWYFSGANVTTTKRISSIEIRSQNVLRRKYDFTYIAGDNAVTTLLSTIQETGYGATGVTTTLPQTKFEYYDKAISWNTNTDPGKWVYPNLYVPGYGNWNSEGKGVVFIDANGDGLTDIVTSRVRVEDYDFDWNHQAWIPRYVSSTPYEHRTFINTGSSWIEDPIWDAPVPTLDMYGRDYGSRFMDINGDGLIDIVSAGPNKWTGDTREGSYSAWHYVFRNTGAGWEWDQSYYPPGSFVGAYGVDKGIRLVDVNGDGLIDALRSTYTADGGSPQELSTLINKDAHNFWGDQNDWQFDSRWDLPVPIHRWFNINSNVVNYPSIYFLDLNGDGLQDILWEAFSGIANEDELLTASGFSQKTYINTGSGWRRDDTYIPSVFLAVRGFIKDEGEQDKWVSNGGAIADVNGDGFQDLINTKITWDFPQGVNTTTVHTIELNTGHGWQSVSTTLPIDLVKNAGHYNEGCGCRPAKVEYGVRIADFNGDGLADIIDQTATTTHFLSAGIADLLTKIILPTGAVTDITYKPAGWFYNGTSTNANPLMPSAQIYPVSQMTTRNGIDVVASSTYAYEGGWNYFDQNWRWDKTFAGFAKVTSTDDAAIKTTYFHQGNTTTAALGEETDDRTKIGMVYREEIRNLSGALYDVQVNQWIASGPLWTGPSEPRLRYRLYSPRTVAMTYDGDSSHRDIATTRVFDKVGNTATTTFYGEVTAGHDGTFSDIGNDLQTQEQFYATNASGTLTGFVSRAIESDQSTQTKDSKYYYDGLSFGSVLTGNQTKIENWKTASAYTSSQKAYNPYGLVASSTDPRGKVTAYAYESAYLYSATTTNPLGQITRALYDYAFGKPTKITDPNGLITQATYDGLGRITQKQAPDLTTSSTQAIIESFEYTDTSGSVSVKNTKHLSSTSTVDRYSYYDGLGRLIQTRAQGATSTLFHVKDYSYNDAGLLEKESLPYFSSGSASTTATTTSALFTSYTYDPLQRVKTASNSLGNTTTTYSDWQATIVDPNGKTKDLIYDAYKRLVEVNEHDDAATYETLYEYDGNGNLTKITDALGNIRNFTYDALGRRLTAEDLHAVGDGTFGSWTYTYDDAGNLTSQVDPKSQTINYSYDDVNRPLTEDFTGQAGTEVTYTYDACAYGIGSLCTSSSSAVRIVNAYNPRQLLATTTSTIDGTNYRTSYTYDRQGNQLTMTNPDNSQIKYEYAGDRFLKKVSKKETTDGSFVSVINNLEYAPNEQISSVSYANGVSQTNTFDPAKLYRLTRRIGTLPNASKAQDLTYTYDPVGNITQLADAGATNTRRTVTYTYDDLHRLISANATGTPAGISGYSQTFSYDAIGNPLTSDQGSYTYAGTSYANPHAATMIGSSGLEYDNNGNLMGTTSFSSSGSGSGWPVNGGLWNRRRSITIDRTKVGGTSVLTNFSALISNTDVDFKSVANGGFVSSSTGSDIFFTSADGTTKLSHEIEGYSPTTGELTAWVLIPSLATSTDTVLYMYYGNTLSTNQQNKNATWDTNTKGVWHFNNSLLDSTSNTNHGTNFGSAHLSSGKIASARSFTGTWDRMTVTSSASLQPSTQISLSAWINQTGSQPSYAKPLWYGQNIANPWGAYGFYIDTNSDMATQFSLSSTSTPYGTGPAMLTTSTWQYLVGTYDGSNLKLYLDGNQVSTSSAAFKLGNYNATSGFSFGTSWNQDADWNGNLDEVRVASTTRSSGWIKTEYNNQNSPSTFYVLGTPSTNSATSTSSTWYGTGGTWSHRKSITVDRTKVSPVNQTTLTDFPLLVSVTNADLKTVANGGKVGKVDGTDIVFTSSSGLTKLNHEIESYTSTTGALVAWVRVPTLTTSTDTGLYLYFGNSSATDQQNKTATWEGNAKGVWHFNNSLLDSTSNANNGTNNGTTNLSSGKIGAARGFTGVWDRMTVTSSASLQPSTQITLSAWINQTGAQPNYAKPLWYGRNDVSPWGAYGFYIDANSDMALSSSYGSTSTSYGVGPVQLTTSTWQYIVGTYDGSSMKLYLDGSLISSGSAAFKIGHYNATSGFSFGTSWGQDADWNGNLDEVRVASTTRSADWIKTEYNNQSTSTMLSYGALQASSTTGGSGTSTVAGTFTWDCLNRLTQVVSSGTTSVYSYDPSNERIKAVVTTSTTLTTRYPTKFYNITNGIPTKHVFANGVMIATITGSGSTSTVSSILTDHLTGASVVTNASGTITELSDYYPYGGVRVDNQLGFNEQRKFAGHEFDASTGLSYMHARYYNSSYGRFLSEDPVFWEVGQTENGKKMLFNPQTFNSYSYAGNNPLTNRDPDGRFWWEGFYDWRGYNGFSGVMMKTGEVFGGHERALNAMRENKQDIRIFSELNGVDPRVTNAIIYEEQSHLTPDEILGREQLFPEIGRGGVGLMQVSGPVGEQYGGYSKTELVRNSTKNINSGTGYLNAKQNSFSASDESSKIIEVGTKYNGSLAYGQRIEAQVNNANYNTNIVISVIQKVLSTQQKLVDSIKNKYGK